MLSTGQEIIRYADTKLGLLLTAAAVTVPTLRDQAVWLAERWDVESGRSVSSSALGALGFLFFAMTIVTAGYGLAPRLRSPRPTARGGEPFPVNRFAWPTLVGREPEKILSLPAADVRSEAAHQLVALSTIADLKFRRFAFALSTALLGGALVASSALIGWGLPVQP